jgi:hypothetical protein
VFNFELRAACVCYRNTGGEVSRERSTVRWIGILGILAAFVTGSADAMDMNRSCLDLLEENDGAKVSPAQDEQPLLTDNQCEAMKSREFRLLLLDVPQEEEDPVQLSLGIRNGGAILRLKIPFSF